MLRRKDKRERDEPSTQFPAIKRTQDVIACKDEWRSFIFDV